MEAKKHRRKIKRTVMIVSNDINRTFKQHNLSTVIALSRAFFNIFYFCLTAIFLKNSDNLLYKINDTMLIEAVFIRLNIMTNPNTDAKTLGAASPI